MPKKLILFLAIDLDHPILQSGHGPSSPHIHSIVKQVARGPGIHRCPGSHLHAWETFISRVDSCIMDRCIYNAAHVQKPQKSDAKKR